MIFSCSDGADAKFKIANAPPNCVLISTGLPKKSEIQLTEWIVGEDKLSKVPVILLVPQPQNDLFVDEVVTGRIQFLDDFDNVEKLQATVLRAIAYSLMGDRAEFFIKNLKPGEVLIKENDPGEFVYLVKRGKLLAYKVINGEDISFGDIDAGEFVGEMAFINSEPRSANVRAVTECELIEIPAAKLDLVLYLKPSWTKAIIKTLSKRLKNANADKIKTKKAAS